MLLQISILLLSAGASDSLYWQKLTCPYGKRHEALPRVWCKKNTTQCCTGFAFSSQIQSVDGGKLEVTHGFKSFTVTVLDLTYGEGVYWCGVLVENETIVKLAEGYFHWSSGAYVWSIARWILLPLLIVITIITSLSFRRITVKDRNKEYLYEDVAMAQAEESTDPQYENTQEPVTELE